MSCYSLRIGIKGIEIPTNDSNENFKLLTINSIIGITKKKIMETKEFKSSGEQQTLRFTISYNKERPIAVADFTSAIDGLNQLYKSYVHQQLTSEEFAKHKKEINEEEIGQFYIREINKGSIVCTLITMQGVVNIIGLLGGISSLLSFGFYLIDKIANRHHEDYHFDNCTFNNCTFNNLKSLNKLLQPINEDTSITLETEGQEKDKVIINYSNKRVIEHILRIMDNNLSDPYWRNPITSFRNAWVQIEIINGISYASIIDSTIMPSIKLPVEIRNIKFDDWIKQSDFSEDLKNRFFLVDIDLFYPGDYYTWAPHEPTKYVIYNVYDCRSIDSIINK